MVGGRPPPRADGAKPATSSQSPSPKTTASPSTTAAAPAAPRSTAAGRVSTTCRAAAASSSTSRRSRAGTSRTHLVAFSAVSYRAKGADKPALGTIKLEADTSVAVAERLVSLQNMKIAEANFQTLPKDQLREIVDRDRQGDPRRRARHRARSRARQHRQEPDRAEERRGHQGRSADDLLQQDAGGARQPRRRADLESDQGQRSEVRGQHELGSVPARADATTFYLRNDDDAG